MQFGTHKENQENKCDFNSRLLEQRCKLTAMECNKQTYEQEIERKRKSYLALICPA